MKKSFLHHIIEAMERDEAEHAEWIKVHGQPTMLGLSAFLNAIQTWFMPDGTKSVYRPKDGQQETTFDGLGAATIWEWDDFQETWHNVSSGKPNKYNTATFPAKGPRDPFFDIDDEHIDYVPVYSWKDEEPKCECGSEKSGSNRHSTWCKKFTP